MDYKLIGFRRQQGKFVDKDTGAVIEYDNVLFQCTHKPIEEGIIGEQCSDFKIPSRFIEDKLSGEYIVLKNMIGKNVIFDSVPSGRSIKYVDILEVK